MKLACVNAVLATYLLEVPKQDMYELYAKLVTSTV